MNITIFHYETSADKDYYDKDEFINVHSVEIDLTQGVKVLSFITENKKSYHIEYRHPVYIEFTLGSTK